VRPDFIALDPGYNNAKLHVVMREGRDDLSALTVAPSVRPFVSPPIKRRHARQRIAEKGRCQALLVAQCFAAITIGQCQRIGPKTLRERSRFTCVEDFGHCSLPPSGLPSRSPRARQHLGQTVTLACPNWDEIGMTRSGDSGAFRPSPPALGS